MKAKEKSRVIKVALIVAAIVTAVAYSGIAIYYRMHFYPNTRVGDLNVSGMTPAEVEKAITAEIEDYSLILLEREGAQEEIPGKEIGLKPDYGMAMEEALADQTGFGWILHLFTQREMDRQPVAYEEAGLERVIENLSCMQQENQTAPENAYLTYENGSYRIVPEVYGTTIKQDVLKQNLQEAVLDLQESVDLQETGCYQDPTVLSDDEKLNQALDQANVCVRANLTYKAGEQTLECSADRISSMLTYDEEGNVSLKDKEVDRFIAELDDTFSTLGKEKLFHTSYGKNVTISRSDYGWKVDTEAEKESLKAAVLSGSTETREPIFSQRAASFGTYDYGNSYVEINLTAQHLFLYVKGNLVLETDFVSGNESNGNATRLGMMMLKYKQKDAVLRGDDYETPVNYWMPFDGNIGMHDATWRSKFGGDIYKTGGSHGCVNLPLSAAKTIFENIQSGEPVVVYKLKGTEPKEPEEKDVADNKKTNKKNDNKNNNNKNNNTGNSNKNNSNKESNKNQSGTGSQNQTTDSNKEN